MAEELRLGFILISSLVIGGVLLHGIWTVRRTVNDEHKQEKEQQPHVEETPGTEEEQEVQQLKLKQMEMNFSELQAPANKEQGLPVADLDVDAIYQEHEEVTDAGVSQNDIDTQQSEDVVEELNLDSEHSIIDVEVDVADEEQNFVLDIDEATANVADEPQIGDIDITDAAPTPTIDKVEKKQPPQQVLMLYVSKPEGIEIQGAKLLPTLLTLGFKYGDMDMFHRHEHNFGHGDVLFSLANMYNPGTFDIETMEQMSTRGLTIFMTLPNSIEPLQAFNMMHNAAKKIAEEFSADVLDDQRRPLDVAIVRGYVEKIRKFQADCY